MYVITYPNIAPPCKCNGNGLQLIRKDVDDIAEHEILSGAISGAKYFKNII